MNKAIRMLLFRKTADDLRPLPHIPFHYSKSDISTSSAGLSTIADDVSERSFCVLPAQPCLKVKNQAESLSKTYTPSNDEKKKTLGWSTVDIHYHSMELGDHPEVLLGPPLTISWSAMGHETLSIDEIKVTEKMSNLCPFLPKSERELILKRAGYKRRDIVKAMVEVRKVRTSRARSKKEKEACKQQQMARSNLEEFWKYEPVGAIGC